MAAFKLMEHKNRYNLLFPKNVPYLAESQLQNSSGRPVGLCSLFVYCVKEEPVWAHIAAPTKIKLNKPSDLLHCKGDT